MTDSYRSGNPNYRPYIERAQRLRSEAFHAGLSFAGGAALAWLRKGLQRLQCRQKQHRAEQQLLSLSSATLKDIGLSRGEVSWRVREALPCS